VHRTAPNAERTSPCQWLRANQREEKESTAAAYLACVRYETVLTSDIKHEPKQNMNALAKLVKATGKC